MIAFTEGKEKARDFRMLKSREEMRQSHKNIKVAQKKKRVSGTEKLTKTDPDDHNVLIEVTDKAEMEEMLMEANERKFRGAMGTPLTVEQLKTALGPMTKQKKLNRYLLGISHGSI